MGSVIESVTDPIFVLRKEPFNMDDLQPLRVDETPTYDRKAFFVQGVRVGHTNEKHHYELVREDKDGYYIYKPKKSKKTIYGIPCPKPFIITENIVPELEAYTKSSELKDHITNITPKAWEVDKASYSFIGVSAGTCLGYGATLFDFSHLSGILSAIVFTSITAGASIFTSKGIRSRRRDQACVEDRLLDLYKTVPNPSFPFILGEAKVKGAISFPHHYTGDLGNLLRVAADLDKRRREGGQSDPELYDSIIRLSLHKRSLEFLVDSDHGIEDPETKELIQSGMKMVNQKIEAESSSIRSITEESQLTQKIRRSSLSSPKEEDRLTHESETFSNVVRFINSL